MKKCIHDQVCEHRFDEEECSLTEICKYYECSTIKKTTLAKSQTVATRDGEAVESTIRRARVKIALLKKHGKLTDEQLRALDALEGKHVKKLTVAEKSQIIDIAYGRVRREEE